MKRTANMTFRHNMILGALLCLVLIMPAQASAANVSLATAPLADSTQALVLPNLMYVIDNSGSMDWDYMPDYLPHSNKCKDDSNSASGSFTWSCAVGHPPYMTKEFNSIYYNPEITYVPGVDSTGVSMSSMTSANTAGWTAVPTDPYGKQRDDQLGNSRTTISLIPDGSNSIGSGYPDRVWCNTSTSGLSVADLSNPTICNANDSYVYPTSTFMNSAIKYTYPYYYNVTPTEYCENKDLTVCQATKDSTHIYPARLRWCNSVGSCQAKFTDSTYNRVKWLGVTTAAQPAKIKINATAFVPSASPSALSVTNVTVSGVRIIPVTPVPALTITDAGNATERNTLAANIAANINTYPDVYTATASGDEVTIVGTTSTATIALTSTTANATNSVPVQATGSFRITGVSRWGTQYVSGIQVGGTEILNQTIYSSGSLVNGAARRINLASDIVNRINSYVSSPDYTASYTLDTNNRPTVTITAVNGGASSNGTFNGSFTNGISVDRVRNVSGGGTTTATVTYNIPVTLTHFTGGVPVVASFSRVDIIPGNNYPKASTRTDCAGLTCTYEEEMTNFANWYSYYRTRMQMMKTSTSIAFKDIDSSYRVGYNAINNQSSNYLKISKFDASQKASWYSKLFDTNPNGTTPLRPALSNIGRLYAGKKPFGNSDPDPMEYSCQQNFTLLTTDGYWRGNTGNIRNVNGGSGVGDTDGNLLSTKRPLYDATKTPDTLADVANYYYDIDLRDGVAGSAACTGAVGVDVCENNVPIAGDDDNNRQHMTTYTLGLGVDGQIEYDSGYKTQTSGAFYDLTQGTINWPKPISDTLTTVDDLWHAAVNGRGTYFSAKDPNQLSGSLSSALNAITAVKGIGAAAATSNLSPVPGDNFSYVASYETVNWRGNLEAREINLSTLEIDPTPVWCIVDVGTCSGTLKSRIGVNTDTRDIKMSSSSNLINFNYSNLTATSQNSNFDQTFLSSNLSQWSNLSSAQQAIASGSNLVNYIRGQTGFEDITSNLSGTTDNRVFRQRLSTLGDIIESKPAYNGIPKAAYTDPGYGGATVVGTFANQQASREGTIYVGANDGMLHAFNAETGFERWAYIPTPVIPNLWKLADKTYSNNHKNFVNGSPAINDVCVANCTSAAAAVWNTVLVSGLNGGGRGYFAMNITDPDDPKLLWEFDDTDDADLGYTYGNPIITKRKTASGEQWVVVFASGYNNTGGVNADKGVLFVLDAVTGVTLEKYVTTGSGLSKITAFVSNASKNNLSEQIYGGDLEGNVWRFDINNPPAAGDSTTQPNPFKFAKLQAPNASGVMVDQPITTRIELGLANNKRMLYIPTGKYLEISDLSDTETQSIYAISDESYNMVGNAMTTFTPRTISSGVVVTDSQIVEQVLTNNATGGGRTVTNNSVSSSKRGWFADFPDARERSEIDPRLTNGVIEVITITPGNSVCSPGGTGGILRLNYKTGGVAAGVTTFTKYNAPIAGVTIIYDPQGNAKELTVLRDGRIPPGGQSFGSGGVSGFNDHRVIWRELTDEQQ